MARIKSELDKQMDARRARKADLKANGPCKEFPSAAERLVTRRLEQIESNKRLGYALAGALSGTPITNKHQAKMASMALNLCATGRTR